MKILQNVAPAVLAFRLIESLSLRWLGDAAELASLGKSPPGNVTTEMGLALGDVADVVRAHPGAIEPLRAADDGTLVADLRDLAGGAEVARAFKAFLERYGMRGTGEIDITRPRWREVPTQLIPAIEGHLKRGAPGQHRRDFLAGEGEAEGAAATLLNRPTGGAFRLPQGAGDAEADHRLPLPDRTARTPQVLPRPDPRPREAGSPRGRRKA